MECFDDVTVSIVLVISLTDLGIVLFSSFLFDCKPFSSR